MENINDVIDYIDENIKYIECRDGLDFSVLKKSVKNRPTGLCVPPDIYWKWMEEDIALGKIKQRVEIKKIIMEQQEKEAPAAVSEEDARKTFEETRNIKRDGKGRLNKGALLAKKENCNEVRIYLLHEAGASVKEIIEIYGCSKSVVYRILAKYKNKG